MGTGGVYGIGKRDENKMKQWLSTYGPLMITVNAGDPFHHYKKGILSSGCSCTFCFNKITHAVLLVGYGPGYWILKNSWGSKWGEGGYMRIKLGVNCRLLARDGGTIPCVQGSNVPGCASSASVASH